MTNEPSNSRDAIPASGSESGPAPGEPSRALITALSKLLRPLVKLMLSFQITYPFIVNLLKSIYVEVAESEFSVDGKRQSDSRITLLTGVHRKDVKRLRARAPEQAILPRNISAGAQMIATWMGSERFCDNKGKPLPLPLRTASPAQDAATFDELVEMVCRQDIRPRVILDEWLRLGVAHQDNSGFVVLNTGAFTPDKGLDEKLFFFGKSLQDHISAGTHNLLGQKPAFFDRSVYYDRLSEESLAELQRLVEEVGMQALVRINHEALLLQKADATKTADVPAHYRMNFGIFHYNDQYEKQVKDVDHA